MAKDPGEGAGTCIRMETAKQTSTFFDAITLERILAPGNLLEALEQVERNKGAPGVDGMRTDELRDWIRSHPGQLTNAIRTGKYCPKPVKRVTIPKQEKGKFRNLGIPTVIDRLVQQAVAQVMNWSYETIFSDSSCGFRPHRGAQDAILRCLNHADRGNVWTADMDLAKFFDTVNHSRLIRKLSDRIRDGRVISLIHRMLKSGIDTGEEILRPTEGLMQGGPLSPLLANIYLDELDKELEKRGHCFVRYADDLIILCKSKRAAERTLEGVTKFVEERMKLKVNRDKSGVAHLTQGVKFLGYGFYRSRKLERYIPTVHAKSKRRLADSLRLILARNRRGSLEDVKESLRTKLTGWAAYFKWAHFQNWARELDKWIRRRIRQLLWRTWKKVRTRYRALRRLGCEHRTAMMWANTRKGSWRIAKSQVLAATLKDDFLKAHDWVWLSLVAKPVEWKK